MKVFIIIWVLLLASVGFSADKEVKNRYGDWVKKKLPKTDSLYDLKSPNSRQMWIIVPNCNPKRSRLLSAIEYRKYHGVDYVLIDKEQWVKRHGSLRWNPAKAGYKTTGMHGSPTALIEVTEKGEHNYVEENRKK